MKSQGLPPDLDYRSCVDVSGRQLSQDELDTLFQAVCQKDTAHTLLLNGIHTRLARLNFSDCTTQIQLLPYYFPLVAKTKNLKRLGLTGK